MSAQLPDITAGVAAFRGADSATSCCPPKWEHADKSATLATPNKKVAGAVLMILISKYQIITDARKSATTALIF
jgi:hypothetical protein